jgi:ferredoxin
MAPFIQRIFWVGGTCPLRGISGRIGRSFSSKTADVVRVTFVAADGARIAVAVAPGTNILDAAHGNHIDLEGACEGSLACSTCHVILPADFYSKTGQANQLEKLKEPSDEENDMLDLAFGLTETR